MLREAPAARPPRSRPRRGRSRGSPPRRASRHSSRPAAANAASLRCVTSRRIRYGIGFQRNEATSYSGSPSIGFGSIATYPVHRREHVVVVEVPVHERRRSDLELAKEPSRRGNQPAPRPVLRPLEPASDMVSDPAEGRPGGPPELATELDRDAVASSSSSDGEIVPRSGTAEQERAPLRIVAEQRNGRRHACPLPEGVRLLVCLVVPGRRDLEHGVRRRQARRRSNERE